MNKKQMKRRRDMKTKLMAAICMLLVSSIMMVSTTYAWFTLSTAPEVTGINTAVGANGNLEMALLPLHGDATQITSATGDSMAVAQPKDSNITWGNLVKLDGTGDNSYGLDQIVMYPSELNTNTVGSGDDAYTQLADIILKTPEYGADGRVSELNANTLTGVYQNGGFYQTANGKRADGNVGAIDKPYGVRGIGTVSGMSPRNLAFRLAMSNASAAALSAKSTASTTLNNNGSKLADIAIAYALSNSDEYSQADVDAITNVLNDLQTGTLVQIETALKNYIVAATIAPAAADSNYEAIVTAIDGATLADLKTGTIKDKDGNDIALVLPGETATYITKLIDMKSKVDSAKNGLPSGKTTYTWSEISTPMGQLIDSTYLKVNGKTVSEVKADPGSILNDVIANGLVVTVASGSGIFADIADFCGDYSAEITISNLKYGTLEFKEPVAATMKTATTVDTVYLTAASNGVGNFSEAGGNGGANPITDFYGYIIDLAFRTNAANSWLQIQQTAADRIYADGANVNTMGHGATMTFTVTDSVNFPGESVKNLMSAIRIIFFDPSDNNKIIGYARLDNQKTDTSETNKIKMPLVMCNAAGNTLTNDPATTQDDSIAIMELNQNQIHQLSILVYLDGNVVGNDDVPVAANLIGSMNLQFSSSANLTPMQYADLKAGEGGALNGNNNNNNTGNTTPTVVNVGSISNGYAATAGYGTYATQSGICAVITETTGNTQVTSGVTVTIDGTTATYVDGAGWVVPAQSAPTGDVAIVVTPTGTGG